MATRVQLVAEELLTGLQPMGGKERVILTVAYEEATGNKEVVLRHNISSNTFEVLDELSEILIRNCATDIKYDNENGYNVLTVCIKD